MDPSKRCTFGSGKKLSQEDIGDDSKERRRLQRREQSRQLWRERVMETPGELQALFEEIDADGSGSITYKELLRYFQLQGLEMLVEDGKATFDALDKDGSSTVDFDEFEAWITQDHSKAAIARQEKLKYDSEVTSGLSHSDEPAQFVGASAGGMAKSGATNQFSADRYASGKVVTFGRKTSRAFGFKSHAESSFNAATMRRNLKRQQLRDTLRDRLFSGDQIEEKFQEMLQDAKDDSDDEEEHDGGEGGDGDDHAEEGVPFEVFKNYLRKNGLPLMYEDADLILEEMDSNGDKQISLEELEEFFLRDHSKAGMSHSEKKKYELEMDAHGHVNWGSGKPMTGHDSFVKAKERAAAKPKRVLSREQSASREQLLLQMLSTDSKIAHIATEKLAELAKFERLSPTPQQQQQQQQLQQQQQQHKASSPSRSSPSADGFADDIDNSGETAQARRSPTPAYSQTYPLRQSPQRGVHRSYSASARMSQSQRQQQMRQQEEDGCEDGEDWSVIRHEASVRVSVLNRSAERRQFLVERSGRASPPQHKAASPKSTWTKSTWTATNSSPRKRLEHSCSSSYSMYFSERQVGNYGHGRHAKYGIIRPGSSSPSSVATSSLALSPSRTGAASKQYKAKKISDEMKVFRRRQWAEMPPDAKTYMYPHDTLPYKYAEQKGAWSCLLDGTSDGGSPRSLSSPTGSPVSSLTAHQQPWRKERAQGGQSGSAVRSAWGS
jgi:Ca2+-binding EF-hand superfamily protein